MSDPLDDPERELARLRMRAKILYLLSGRWWFRVSSKLHRLDMEIVPACIIIIVFLALELVFTDLSNRLIGGRAGREVGYFLSGICNFINIFVATRAANKFRSRKNGL